MKQINSIKLLLWAIIISSLPAQTFESPTIEPAVAVYEDLPELKASEILRPEFLKGTYFTVRDEVPTYSGANHFTIDSEFGVFEAEGNEMLVRRINEINAIARLKEVSRTDEFKGALVKAAKSPAASAKQIVTDPVNAITNAPKGVMKFMGRIGESVKGIGQKHQGNDPEGSQVQQIIGFSDTKRKVAMSLGVDPYSSNTVLQHELDGISWASFAGGATFSLATMPIGGGAATALTVTEVSGDMNEMLREKSPTDLRIINRKSLLALGASEKDAERFLNNNAFSPSAQTAFVLNLKSMSGVANRDAFVRLGGETTSGEPDAIFCVQTAALMSKIHKSEQPLARIVTFGDFPVCVAKDGTTIVALQWDYAAWTAGAGRFSEQLRKFAEKPPANKKVLVAISGQTSSRLRQELEKLGDGVKDRFSPGPLK
jgi:hypothetical protein